MSARSRARKNKRCQLIPAWDLQVARYNHAWTVWAKKAKGIKGLYPIMINPRANGRIYQMRSMIEALGKGPILVRGLNGDVLKGVMAHPTKIGEDGSVEGHIKIGNSMVSPYDSKEVSEFMRKHPPIVDPNEGPTDAWLKQILEEYGTQDFCFSMRAIADRTEQPKEIINWNMTQCDHRDPIVDEVAAHVKKIQLDMGLTPEMLHVDPSMLGREHGEFGGLCAPVPKGTEVDPRELVEMSIPFEARSQSDQANGFAHRILWGLKAIDGECKEIKPQTATEVLQNQILLEKRIASFQSLLGSTKPFDEFYLKAPISVYELFERMIEVLPDGAWIPKQECRRTHWDQLKIPHESGPFMLATISANEYEECRTNLETFGYVKIVTQCQEVQFVPGEPVSKLVKRYFLIVMEANLKPDPHGFRMDSRPDILDLMMRTSYEEF